MLSLILTLVVVGVLLYCVNRFIPMDANIKKIINIVAVICVIVFLLNAFGVLGRIDHIGVPQVK